MSDLPPEFDLKLMPDWLKEQPAKNPYANFEGERERRPRSDDRGPGRNDRPRPPRRDGGGRPDGGRQGERGPKRHGDSRDSRDSRRPSQDRFQDSRDSRPPARVQEQPAPVKIEFFPETHFVEAVIGYIRNTGHAYALFDLARSFLVKQDRHRVKITVTEPGVVLHQVGERGAVTLDANLAEKAAFKLLQKELYTEEVLEKEPLKGNFSNVARCRLSGEILGPTSHHSYQLALRKHYEQRFSRRMSFQDFLREIETTTKPEDIEAWKDSARRSTVFKTVVTEGEPTEFADMAQVEAHFRQHHLPTAIRSGTSFEMTGVASHNLPDRRIADAVQSAWEKERAFPGQMMFHLREQFVRAGLHFFKHYKRQQFICATRPQLIKEQGLSEHIVKILRAIEEKPGCTRVDIAHKFFEADQESPELPKMKSALASDLHWLRQAGHIIEFSDSKLDLPRKKTDEDSAPQRPQGRPQPKPQPAKAEVPTAPVTPAEPAPESPALEGTPAPAPVDEAALVPPVETEPPIAEIVAEVAEAPSVEEAKPTPPEASAEAPEA